MITERTEIEDQEKVVEQQYRSKFVPFNPPQIDNLRVLDSDSRDGPVEA